MHQILQYESLAIIAKSALCPSVGLSNLNDVLDNENSRLFKSFKSFLNKNNSLYIAVNEMLEAGFNENSILDCLNEFGLELPHVLSNKPEEIVLRTTYILANDLIAYSNVSNVDISTEQLIRASVISVLKNIALHVGHSCYPLVEVFKKLSPIFPELTVDSYKAIINNLCDDFYITRYKNNGALYLLANAERKVFQDVLQRNVGQTFCLSLNKLSNHLDDSQIQAVNLVSENNFCIINGPPGSGKSTVVSCIIDAALDSGLTKNDILLMATISKAAKRIKHAELDLPQTIHMGLGVKQSQELDRIVSGEICTSKLNKKLVLVDEGAFMDLAMFSRLIASLPVECKIVLVGDENQLAPIGIGFVFRDLLLRGIPSTKLLGSYRSTNGIQQLACDIVSNNFKPNFAYDNVDVLWTKTDLATIEAIEKYVPRLIVHYSLDYIYDLQVLVPTHRNNVGTLTLNKVLQEKMNPDSHSKYRMEHGLFKINDKVMFTKNNYRQGISNGDLGVIVGIDNKDDAIMFSISVGNRLLFVPENEMKNVMLAYAATIHKFNGCELDVILLIIPHEHISILTRNEIYSAVTRAKQRVIIIGSEEQFMSSLQYSSTHSRLTQSVN